MTVIKKKVTKKPTKAQLEEAYKPWGIADIKQTTKSTKKKK